MKRYYLVGVGMLCGLLAGCGSSEELTLHIGNMSWTLQLAVEMQQVASLTDLPAYQEVASQSGEVLDSLLMERIETQIPVAAYTQQQINALKLSGYQISEELSQKKETEVWPSLLKSYKILALDGSPLYMAQYLVQFPEYILTLSYASDSIRQRKQFITSLDQLSFSL